jgi:UrcA family protein
MHINPRSSGPSFLISVGILLAATCGGAWAADQTSISPSTERSVQVRIGDLNLATPQGAEEAHMRIRQAARNLCSYLADSSDVGRQQHYVRCIDRAASASLRQLSAPSVAKLSKGQESSNNKP